MARTQAVNDRCPLAVVFDPFEPAQVTETEIHRPARIRSHPRVTVPFTVVPRRTVVTTRCDRPGPERTLATETQTRRVVAAFVVEARDRTDVWTAGSTCVAACAPWPASETVSRGELDPGPPPASGALPTGSPSRWSEGRDSATTATAAAQHEPRRRRRCGWCVLVVSARAIGPAGTGRRCEVHSKSHLSTA